jgi:hypothetical protein
VTLTHDTSLAIHRQHPIRVRCKIIFGVMRISMDPRQANHPDVRGITRHSSLTTKTYSPSMLTE